MTMRTLRLIIAFITISKISAEVLDLTKTLVDVYTLKSKDLTPACRQQVQYYEKSLKTGDPWALQMFDASSKLPSGVLLGNLVDFGSYDECLAIRHEYDKDKMIVGKHCTFSVMPDEDRTAHVATAMREPPSRVTLISIRHEFGVTLSMCVPDQCMGQDVEKHLKGVLPKLTNMTDLRVVVKDKDCYTAEYWKQPYRTSDWFAIGLGVFVVIAIIICTTYHGFCYVFGIEKPNSWLMTFSAYQHTMSILKVGSGGFECLNGIRFLSHAWLIMLHRFFNRMFTANVNTVHIQDWMRKPETMLILGSNVSVDTFLVMGGMLVLLSFFRSMDKDKKINYFRYYLHRYLRLTPAVAIVMLFNGTLLYHVGSGPMWESTVATPHSACREYWWSGLLYIQNLVNPSKNCIMQTWYLSVDMQLFWLSPIFLLPIYKNPKWAVPILAMFISVPMFLSFYLAWLNHYDGSLPFLKDALGKKYIQEHYVSTPVRSSPWFVGLALGYLIYKTQSQKVVISKPVVGILWFLSLVTMTVVIFSLYPFQQYDYPEMRFWSSVYLGFSRTAWSFAISWIIYASINGYGGIINKFLSWSVFVVLAKLGYGMYLTHFNLQNAMAGATKHPTYFMEFHDVYMSMADVAASVVMSFLLTAGFEMPIHKIEDFFLRQAPPKKKPE